MSDELKSKEEKVIEKPVVVKKKKTVKINKFKCEILFVRNNKTFVKFNDDYSLSVPYKEGDKTGKLIEIEYKGIFGSKNFEIV